MRALQIADLLDLHPGAVECMMQVEEAKKKKVSDAVFLFRIDVSTVFTALRGMILVVLGQRSPCRDAPHSTAHHTRRAGSEHTRDSPSHPCKHLPRGQASAGTKGLRSEGGNVVQRMCLYSEEDARIYSTQIHALPMLYGIPAQP